MGLIGIPNIDSSLTRSDKVSRMCFHGRCCACSLSRVILYTVANKSAEKKGHFPVHVEGKRAWVGQLVVRFEMRMAPECCQCLIYLVHSVHSFNGCRCFMTVQGGRESYYTP